MDPQFDRKLVTEIKTHYILHWNYRRYKSLPMELLESGSHIQELYLKENGLKQLPEALAEKCPSLMNLYLYGNELQSLPECIGDMTHLTVLDLSRNRLTELPDVVGRLSNLKIIDLNYNRIKKLPETIGQLRKLEYCFVNGNELRDIPDQISKCDNLITFHFSGNLLNDVPRSLAECKNLQEIYANDNKITKIPENFTEMSTLKHLSVRDNDLRSLPCRPFLSTPKIVFHNNPNLHHIGYLLACQINVTIPMESTQTWRFQCHGCFKPTKHETLETNTVVIRRNKIDSWNLKLSLRINNPTNLTELCLRKIRVLLCPNEIRRSETVEFGSYQSRIFLLKSTTDIQKVVSTFKLPSTLRDTLNHWKSFCCYCCVPFFNQCEILVVVKTNFKSGFPPPDPLESGFCSLYFCTVICRDSFFEEQRMEIYNYERMENKYRL